MRWSTNKVFVTEEKEDDIHHLLEEGGQLAVLKIVIFGLIPVSHARHREVA